MNMEKCIKESFAVIGKEGSTKDGPGFVQNLWADANAHFAEVAHLAKKDENGDLVGIWGAMTDFSRSFLPWEVALVVDFTLPVWNVWRMRRHLRAGQNGMFPVLNTSGWNATMMACFRK